ncbi:EscV/YscV/HrcV family type III secretion system export apparatus protein [Vibrio ostreicida]|uniref:EscV/YscV/HrcV family type III secretion system export apparatus protein n=1 Tax=Vibrio ostreicida TaxID=526588 RepID=A0ABT8BV86_9VIBR|nr:EscV/YscV/HrcV family type III secretion system export apparatus protein [Vibrio ostreicida]MDN3610027.1 EscV/YscV/HrcV family type III secretion system export apparatus protein [Vibrio ostreicida]NPD10452.1 EscV/YscV/HrcV family type III secretion system export apparatus protein [Vibrio ostreicida]
MTFATRWLAKAAGRQDIILSAMLIIAVFMMILPLPTTLVDVLIAVNLGMSIVLLMIAIYIRDPLEFSAFPSMLLITTLYRLALTISTSRLILLQHDAGDIVYTFGDFVVGGNLAVGIIVFAIITIVQFIVITKGSERVAEVSARFSLDGMPGKQMSIDGDMRAGTIDAKEAKRQRSIVQKESQLYGAMDGAMKFVKGDAIASVIVILTNIFGGVAVGVLQHNMSASEALNTYAVLSVGDGLIAQIPSLLISITAGLIVTRVPGETKNNLANELVQQISRQPSSLQMAAGVMFVFAIIPGFPWFVFGPLGGAILASSLYIMKKDKSKQGQTTFASGEATESDGQREMTPGAVPLVLAIGEDLVENNLDSALQSLRWELFEKLGLPLPEIQLQIMRNDRRDQIELLLYQEPIVKLTVTQQNVLTLSQVEGLASQQNKISFNKQTLHWYKPEHLDVINLSEVACYQGNDIAIALVNMAAQHFAKDFLGVQETRYLMDSMEMRYSELVKELQRLLPVSRVTEILQRLVEENISIRDLRTIFETLVEWASKEKDTVMLTEYVRVALRRHIRRKFTVAEGWIPMVLIGDSIENQVRESIRQSAVGTYSALEPEEEQKILALVKEKLPDNLPCVLLTSLDVRRYLRKIIEPTLPMTPVLSFQEIGDDASIKVIAQVDILAEVPNAIAG